MVLIMSPMQPLKNSSDHYCCQQQVKQAQAKCRMAQPLRCYVFWFLKNSQNRSVKWFSSCRRCSLSKPAVSTTAANNKSSNHKRNVMAQPLRCYVFLFLNNSQNRSVKWFSSCRRCSLSKPAVTTTADNHMSGKYKQNVAWLSPLDVMRSCSSIILRTGL